MEPQKQIGTTGTGTLGYLVIHLKSSISMRYDISKATAPAMPTLGKGTECIKILLTQASKDMHAPSFRCFRLSEPTLAHSRALHVQSPELCSAYATPTLGLRYAYATPTVRLRYVYVTYCLLARKASSCLKQWRLMISSRVRSGLLRI